MTIPPVLIGAINSKKFLVWLVTALIAIANAVIAKIAPGYELDTSLIWTLAIGSAGYSVGQGIDDHGKGAATKSVQLAALNMLPDHERNATIRQLAGVPPRSPAPVASGEISP